MDTLNFNDKRYTVIRVINVDVFEDEANAIEYRDRCHAETILKRDGRYYFCNEIPDAIIIEPVRPPDTIKPPVIE